MARAKYKTDPYTNPKLRAMRNFQGVLSVIVGAVNVVLVGAGLVAASVGFVSAGSSNWWQANAIWVFCTPALAASLAIGWPLTRWTARHQHNPMPKWFRQGLWATMIAAAGLNFAAVFMNLIFWMRSAHK